MYNNRGLDETPLQQEHDRSRGRYPKLLSTADRAYDWYLGLGLPPLRAQTTSPAERAEAEWVTGVWNYLDRPHELARYSLLSGYCRYFGAADSNVLDLGCGDGLMRGQLDSFGRYTGIDISPTAVKRAAERWQDERTSFAVGDVTTAPGRYDVVIVNEIMQVVPDPAVLAEGVSRLLEPGGVLLLSIHHDTRRNRLLWKAVDARFACVDAVRVKSESSGRTWRVACYRKD